MFLVAWYATLHPALSVGLLVIFHFFMFSRKKGGKRNLKLWDDFFFQSTLKLAERYFVLNVWSSNSNR